MFLCTMKCVVSFRANTKSKGCVAFSWISVFNSREQAISVAIQEDRKSFTDEIVAISFHYSCGLQNENFLDETFLVDEVDRKTKAQTE